MKTQCSLYPPGHGVDALGELREPQLRPATNWALRLPSHSADPASCLAGRKGGGLEIGEFTSISIPRTAGRLAGWLKRLRPVSPVSHHAAGLGFLPCRDSTRSSCFFCSSYFDFSFFSPLQRRSPEIGQFEPYSWNNLLLTKRSEDGCPRLVVPVNQPVEEPRAYSTDAGYCVPVSREVADLARAATARTPASEDRSASLVKSLRLPEAGAATDCTGRWVRAELLLLSPRLQTVPPTVSAGQTQPSRFHIPSRRGASAFSHCCRLLKVLDVLSAPFGLLMTCSWLT